MSPNVNIFFQLSCDAHVKFNRPCWCWVQWIHQYVWGNEWHYWTTGCVHEGLMRLLLSHWFPSENVNVFIIHSAKVYPCDVKLRRRPFIVWDALQDLLMCYQSWHIEQGKPTCHSWKKKRWSWVWIYSQGVEYWNRAIFPLLNTITSMAIKASMEIFAVLCPVNFAVLQYLNFVCLKGIN